jgi:colanic acid/amylovoran biosynthesis protein
MKHRILLINIHSDDNAGDSALTQIAVEQLERNFPGSEVTLVMNDPGSYRGSARVLSSFQNWVKGSFPDKPSRWRLTSLAKLLLCSLVIALSFRLFKRPFYRIAPPGWRSLFLAYVESSLVVSAAGGFLYSSGRVGITMLYNIFTLAFAWLLGKPFYLLPQSIGPLTNRRDELLVRWILEKARIVMVREDLSCQQLKKIGLQNPQVRLVPDLALAFQGGKSEATRQWMVEHGYNPQSTIPRLGMTAINWERENFRFRCQGEYEQALGAAMQIFLEEYGGEVYFFTQVHGPTPGQDDRVPTRRIRDRQVEHQERIHLLLDPVSPEILQSLYGEMDIFIATRLHSAIFALNRHVPVLSIAYQPKTLGVLQMLGLEQWSIPIEEATPDRLVALLRNLWSQRSKVREQIQRSLPGLIQQSNQVGAWIEEDYQAFRTGSRPQ